MGVSPNPTGSSRRLRKPGGAAHHAPELCKNKMKGFEPLTDATFHNQRGNALCIRYIHEAMCAVSMLDSESTHCFLHVFARLGPDARLSAGSCNGMRIRPNVGLGHRWLID